MLPDSSDTESTCPVSRSSSDSVQSVVRLEGGVSSAGRALPGLIEKLGFVVFACRVRRMKASSLWGVSCSQISSGEDSRI
jgi:hypothetical protein